MRKSFFYKIIIINILIMVLFSSVLFPSYSEAEKYNMSYLYFESSDKYIQQVIKTKNSVDTVAPNYFTLSDDGSLIIEIDSDFVEQMQQMNVKVVPFLSNHWDRTKGRKALANRKVLAEQIAEVVEKYDLDGINIDLENLTAIDRDNYTDFIRLLSELIPAEKEISVAVAANPYGKDTGWQGSYDYAKLAEYSDYLMLMTYDESYYGSNPGPVASIDFVEKSIQYALTKAPADKIVLGIPFYGRYWQIGYYGGRGIPLNSAEELIRQFNGKVYFDEKSQSPYALLYIPSGYFSKVHNRTLNPGSYIIWYENDRSIKTKLKLVQKYNLLGTGSWSLNEAPEEIWDYYQQWLNGEHYFIDAEKHWAELDIMSMLNKGWMVGTSSNYFSPNKPLTRAEAVVVLSRALGLTGKTTDIQGNNFTDIDLNYWAGKEIEAAYQSGLINGVEEDKFAPNEPLTRDQIAAILGRVVNLDQEGEKELVNPFIDISTSHWAYQDILRLNRVNIISGYNDGNFHPKDKVTRAQMAALMNRVADKIN